MKAEPVIYTGFILLICIFGTDSSRGETAIDALFQAAVEQVGKVSRKKSIVAFEKIISRDADYAPAYNELAKLHLLDYSVNGRQRARQIIQKAIEQDYKNPAYQLTRAKIMWSQGFWEEALNQYKNVVNQHPKNTDALDGIEILVALLQRLTGKPSKYCSKASNWIQRIRHLITCWGCSILKASVLLTFKS